YDKVSGTFDLAWFTQKCHVIGELMNKPRDTLNHQTRNLRAMYLELQWLRNPVQQAEKRLVIVLRSTHRRLAQREYIFQSSRPNRGRGRPPRDPQSPGPTHQMFSSLSERATSVHHPVVHSVT